MKSCNFAYDATRFSDELHTIHKNNQTYSSVMAQIFTSISCEEKIQEICKNIQEVFQDILIIGTTSDGEILDSSIIVGETIISITFFQNTFLKHVGADYDHSFATCKDFGAHIVSQLPSIPKVLILFADNAKINGDDFLSGISEGLEGCIVTGGLAAGNKTFVFDNNHIYVNSAVGIALYNNDLLALNIAKSGWIPIGQEMVITHAKKNIVYTINNAPAIEVYKHYLGDDIVTMFPKVGIEFPLIVQDKEQVRALLSVRSDGSILLAGNVNTGDKVNFGYGGKEYFLGEHILPPKEIYTQEFESFFIYSCLARRKLIPDDIHLEIEPYAHIAPTCGFFTGGEFFTREEQHVFLNHTMTVLALSEEHAVQKTPKQKEPKKLYGLEYRYSQKAITHLIKRSTEEIEILNKKLEQKVEEKIDEIRRKDIMLFQQSKLASLGEMIGNIAHQWRQPVNAVGALNMQLETMLMQKGLLTYEEYAPIGQSINEQLEFISSTIDDFRIFSKNSQEIESFNIKDSIKNVLSLVKMQLSHNNIEIISDLQNVYYRGSRSELKHVLLNIINNAKDAIVTHTVKLHALNYIFVGLQEKNGTIRITVKDSGGGIDDAIINKIFDPYFTTKFKKQGSGIGLYMSHEIISKHFLGTIKVSNVSTFYEHETFTGAQFEILFQKN